VTKGICTRVFHEGFYDVGKLEKPRDVDSIDCEVLPIMNRREVHGRERVMRDGYQVRRVNGGVEEEENGGGGL
jgi:hypothetical protein